MTQIQPPPAAHPHSLQPHAPHPYAPQQYGAFPPPHQKKRRTGAIVGSVAAGVVTLGGLGVGALFLFGTETLDAADAEQQISAQVQEQTGVAPASVDCPSDVELAQGTTSTCTVDLQGQTFDYTITQLDDEGSVEFTSDAVFVQVTDVETLLADAFAEQGLDVEASCDAGERTVLIAADGLSIPCTVVNAEDSSDSADVTALVDAAGTVTFE